MDHGNLKTVWTSVSILLLLCPELADFVAFAVLTVDPHDRWFPREDDMSRGSGADSRCVGPFVNRTTAIASSTRTILTRARRRLGPLCLLALPSGFSGCKSLTLLVACGATLPALTLFDVMLGESSRKAERVTQVDMEAACAYPPVVSLRS